MSRRTVIITSRAQTLPRWYAVNLSLTLKICVSFSVAQAYSYWDNHKLTEQTNLKLTKMSTILTNNGCCICFLPLCSQIAWIWLKSYWLGRDLWFFWRGWCTCTASKTRRVTSSLYHFDYINAFIIPSEILFALHMNFDLYSADLWV